MDYFPSIHALTLVEEGALSNHHNDRGGFTYRGISQLLWPDWPGWAFVEGELEHDPEAPMVTIGRRLDANGTLQRLVDSFYRENFWDPMKGAALAGHDPHLARQVYDAAVNHGVTTSVRLLQRALNLLNRCERVGSNLKPDGLIGPATLREVEGAARRRDLQHLRTALGFVRGAFYIDIVERDETQEDFIRGWFRRTVVVAQDE